MKGLPVKGSDRWIDGKGSMRWRLFGLFPLFSAAGLTALVYGPGDIAQAHSSDEWVALEQLDTVGAAFLRIMGGPR